MPGTAQAKVAPPPTPSTREVRHTTREWRLGVRARRPTHGAATKDALYKLEKEDPRGRAAPGQLYHGEVMLMYRSAKALMPGRARSGEHRLRSPTALCSSPLTAPFAHSTRAMAPSAGRARLARSIG